MRNRALMTRALAAFVAPIALLVSCDSGWESARVVEVETDAEEAAGWFQMMGGLVSEFADGADQALLLRPGEIVWAGDDDGVAVVPYLDGDGGTLRLDPGEGLSRLADQVVSISLEEDSASAWLQRASDAELAALRLVIVPGPVEPATRPHFDRLAAVNAGVGLSFESQEAAEELLPSFRPRWLWVEDGIGWAPDEAPWLDQVQELWISASGAGELDAVEWAPALRRLVVVEWDVAEAGQLPTELPGLESLALIDFEGPWSPSLLAPIGANLEELTIIGSDDPLALGTLESHPGLRSLDLTGSEWASGSDFADLTRLRRFSLPSNATQAEFAAIVAAHPDLEYLALIGVDDVTDLSPLRTLHDLRFVVMTGTYQNIEILGELTSLEYVGLPADVWEDAPDQVAALRVALPGAALAKVAEFCLGSGWILLLLPAVLLFAFARPRPRHA